MHPTLPPSSTGRRLQPIHLLLVSACLFVLPTIYFLNQNYNIFLKFADYFNPSLAQYLSREKIAFNIFFIILFLIQISVILYLKKRIQQLHEIEIEKLKQLQNAMNPETQKQQIADLIAEKENSVSGF